MVDESNVPAEGPGILAFSHRSYVDPWLLGIATPRAIYGWGKIQLKDWPFFGDYLAKRGVEYVDRDNPGPEAYAIAVEHLAILRHLFAVAIEGTHKNRGPLLGESRQGVARLALKAAAKGIDIPIVTVGISSEDMHKHPRIPIFSSVVPALDRKINVVYGEPIVVAADEVAGMTVKQRKIAAEDLNERVHDGVQSSFTRALEI